jgi:hypothetical protein
MKPNEPECTSIPCKKTTALSTDPKVDQFLQKRLKPSDILICTSDSFEAGVCIKIHLFSKSLLGTLMLWLCR